MRANYHSHTIRCGHAEGTEREYIERAIEGKFEVLGFSDHTPYFSPGEANYPWVRMLPEQLADYVRTLEALRREYAGRIELRIGLEAEYYPGRFPWLLDFLRGSGVEYLILGQHFLGDEIGEPRSGRPTADKRILDRYVCQCIEGMQTGCFSYFAHPDLINFVGDEVEYTRQMRRLCRAAKDAGLPLEINLLGLRKGHHYPFPPFWRIAAEEGNPVILGSDAHRPEHVWAPETEARALELVRTLGLRLLERAELRSVHGGGV